MYAHLAVAGHSLPASGMAALSVLWSIVFLLGLGVFLPIEQELIRLVAARTAAGRRHRPGGPPRRPWLSAIALAVILTAVRGRRAAGRRLFGGDSAMVAVLGGACVALAVTAVSRGTLAGLGRFGVATAASWPSTAGCGRLLACALGLAGARTRPVAFGLILTVAPLLAVLVTLGPLLASLRPGPPGWPGIGHARRLALLIATMLLAQVLINVAVISVRLLSPGDPALVGALLAAVVLARVPLFVFTVAADGPAARAGRRRGRGRPGTVPAAAGPQLRGRGGPRRGWRAARDHPRAVADPGAVRRPPVLGHAAFAWLAAGTLCYMLALVLGQGAMALARHRDQLLSWLAGVAVLTAITAGTRPGDHPRRHRLRGQLCDRRPGHGGRADRARGPQPGVSGPT